MSEWTASPLEKLAEITSGGTPSRAIDEFWNGSIPWVTPTDVTSCRTNYLHDTKEKITPSGLASSSATLLPIGSLLFTSRATIGEIKIAANTVATNQGFKSLSPKPDIEGLFLFYQVGRMKNDFIRYGAGSTFLEINRRDMGRVQIPHPLVPAVQRKIACILETIDRAIEKTEALIEKYHQIKAGMMHDLFTRGLTPNGKPRPPRDEAPELYQETPIGWIPRDWSVKFLADLTVKIVDGVHHTPTYVEHGFPFVTVKNLTASSGIDFTNLNYVDERTHRYCYTRADPKAGDVLVTKDGTLGTSRIVEEGMPEFSIFVSVALLRASSELTAEWLNLFFESGTYLTQLGYLSSGSGLKHIHLEHFRKFQIAHPSPTEQERINSKVRLFEDLISSERSALEKFKLQRSGLMHDLLTGKVPVKIDDQEAADV
ncbi:restriction endonuclease subunit S [Mesorhizobium sp.]|uniref:restriction endonuclease subunit S n=1 Tax=Mesorhizobium sp. TaxID=1871066 RepID=UPI0012230B41|nr:restriction endonuclease subunit S [Mesorhizobium sp.]TIL51684.1 MAG: restriction endonuclease subunit S [Mesorhizobium sp.]